MILTARTPTRERERESKTHAIVINDVGGGDFSALMVNGLIDLHLFAQSLMFPLHYYTQTPKDKNALFNSSDYEQHDGITNYALNEFQTIYKDKSITKEDIFYYIYALLHNETYKKKFKNNLSKELPRIPFMLDFKHFVKVGRELGHLHVNYETLEPSKKVDIEIKGQMGGLFNANALKEIEPTKLIVKQMQFKKGKLRTYDKSIIHYNDFITLTNIPLKAYRYIVNGKSAIEWIMERYSIKIDKDSNIENNANLYSQNPYYILNLLLSVIEVSVRSVDLIESLEYKELNPSLF